MITTMLLFDNIMLIFLSLCYNSIPVWLRIALQMCIFVAMFVAYMSEENLRDKVKRLEDDVKKYKKGGE